MNTYQPNRGRFRIAAHVAVFLAPSFVYPPENGLNHIVAVGILVRKAVLKAISSERFTEIFDGLLRCPKGNRTNLSATEQPPHLAIQFRPSRIKNRVPYFV